MITVGQPITITPPCAVMSPIRAAGMPPIITVVDPMAITSGGPTQTAMSVTRAAGRNPISTIGQQGGRIGPPTCGTRTVTMGQTCISVIRAAKGILVLLSVLPCFDPQFLSDQRAGRDPETQHC